MPTIWFNGPLNDSNLGESTENHQFACALKQIGVSFSNINGISDFNGIYPSINGTPTLIEYSVSVDIDVAFTFPFNIMHGTN